MRKKVKILSIFSLILMLTGCSELNAETIITENAIKEETIKLTGKEEYKDFDLYKEMVDEHKNSVFSPYSIKDCFSLIYDASSGESKKEMNALFGFENKGSDFYREFDANLIDENGYGISIANKAFINEKNKNEINQEKINTENIEIVKMTNETVSYINNYIEEKTNKKIKDLIPESSITEDTPLILTNALYFNNTWDNEDRNICWDDYKNVSAFGKTTDNMELVKEVNKNIDVLRIPYDIQNGNDYSMYIICNSEKSNVKGVDSYLNKITSKEFKEMLDFSDYDGLTGYDEIDYTIPDFEVDMKGSIKKQLQALGLVDPFNYGTTDFKDLGNIYIDDVIHGSYIKVNEYGTEAAASTAIIMANGMIMPPEKEIKIKNIKADSPFVFVIKDDANDSILFIGRIMNP